MDNKQKHEFSFLFCYFKKGEHFSLHFPLPPPQDKPPRIVGQGNSRKICRNCRGNAQECPGTISRTILETSWTISGHCRKNYWNCPGIFREMSKMFPGHFRDMSRTCPGHIQEISKMSRKFPGENFMIFRFTYFSIFFCAWLKVSGQAML